MKPVARLFLMTTLASALLAGCSSLALHSGQASLLDTDWELVSLSEHAGVTGAGGKSPSLRLDAASQRAAGFAGCNRYNAGYELAGNSIRFNAPVATRMACMDGAAIEQSFLASLPLVTSYVVAGRTLTLKVADSTVAVFRAR